LTGQSTKSSNELKKMDFPPTSMQEMGLDYVATGRFTFYRKHLYFSFYTNKPDRPRMVQFIDTNGNIIEEIVSPKFRCDQVVENKSNRIDLGVAIRHLLPKPDEQNLRSLATSIQRLQAIITRGKDIRIISLGHGYYRRLSLQVS
jgi:hypothetical protein